MKQKLHILLAGVLLLVSCGTGKSFPKNEDPEPETSTNGETTSTALELAYVALNDNGANGPLLGCGDSQIFITQTVETTLNTKEKIQTALEALFNDKEQFKGASGLYNALYQSALNVESVTVSKDTVRVELSGEALSGGECDDPRIVEQIEGTVTNNLDSENEFTIIITLNGNPIEKLQDLSGR